MEKRLRDQLIVGIRSDSIRKKLMEKERKDLREVVSLARDMELVERALKVQLLGSSSVVHNVSEKKRDCIKRL